MSLASLRPDRLLTGVAQRHPDATALVDPARGVEFSYAQLDRQVDALAAAFHAGGYLDSDRVVIAARNRWQLPTALLALGRSGLVAVPADPRSSPAELDDLAGRSGATLTITESDGAGGRGATTRVPVDALLVDGPPPRTAGAGRAVDLPARTGTIMHTSGSTGRPKLVCLPWGWDGLNAVLCLVELRLTHTDRALHPAPLFHAGPWACGFLPALAAGAANIVHRFDPEATLAAIDELAPTFVLAVPTHYELMRRASRSAGEPRHRLELAVLTAAPPRLATARWVAETLTRRTGFMYGLTEAGGAVTYGETDPTGLSGERAFIGRPLPGVDVELRDADGDERHPARGAARGELHSRTDKQLLGYLGDPAATGERLRHDGWMRSGDLVERDGSDDLFVVDRTDDLIVSGGENVSPSAVEDSLLRHPDITDCAVRGEDDEVWGQRVVAYLVGSHPPTADELVTWLRSTRPLPRFMWPRQVRHIDRVPRNTTGKIQRRLLPADVPSSRSTSGAPRDEPAGGEPSHAGVATGGSDVVR